MNMKIDTPAQRTAVHIVTGAGTYLKGFEDTSALTSVASLLTQLGRPTTEGEVVRLAIDSQRSAASMKVDVRSTLCLSKNRSPLVKPDDASAPWLRCRHADARHLNPIKTYAQANQENNGRIAA